MPKYNVHVFQRVIEEAWIEVEAESREGAEDAAVEKAMIGDAQWSFLETCDSPVEVVDCEIEKTLPPLTVTQQNQLDEWVRDNIDLGDLPSKA